MTKDESVTSESIFRPEGRSVWLGKDLSRAGDWIFPFPQEAIAEIDDCLRRVRESGKPLEDIGTADFPFATIATQIASFKQELATGRGFVIVRGLPSDQYSDDDLGKIFWGFGAHFGLAMPPSFLGDRLGTVMDLQRGERERRLWRGSHSARAQLAHSE